MAKNKTMETEANVVDFIKAFADSEQKRMDSFELLKLMKEATGHEAKMWGPSIIGFGKYHYKYASGHEGTAPIVGFSPRNPLFHYMLWQIQKSKNTCSSSWANLKWAKPVFISKSFPIST